MIIWTKVSVKKLCSNSVDVASSIGFSSFLCAMDTIGTYYTFTLKFIAQSFIRCLSFILFLFNLWKISSIICCCCLVFVLIFLILVICSILVIARNIGFGFFFLLVLRKIIFLNSNLNFMLLVLYFNSLKIGLWIFIRCYRNIWLNLLRLLNCRSILFLYFNFHRDGLLFWFFVDFNFCFFAVWGFEKGFDCSLDWLKFSLHFLKVLRNFKKNC